jgi:Base plate wedge protein 53
MSRYFNRFPLVDYDGVPAKNILARVDFTDQTKKDIYSNFDYVLQEGLSRPDILSFNYYNSSQYDWLIYLSNNIVDPYHDYYMSDDDFRNYIIGKYGSSDIARNRILYYRNDWSADESLISEYVYDNLDSAIKKYWKPKLNTTNQIVGYERVKEDWIASTNRIVELTVDADISAFAVGDIIRQNDAEGTLVSKDEVNNILTVQHVSGVFTEDVTGITKVSIIKENITPVEEVFWAPVSAYSEEEEKNELKRYITLIKSSYLSDIEKLFIEQLKK